jgi:hypothetical protein
MDEAENEVHAASYEILSVGTDAGILCNVRKIQTEGAVMKPATPKTELPPSTQLWSAGLQPAWDNSARNPGGQPALRFYGDARSLKNKILFVDNFRVKQLNRLVPPGNLWL